MAYSLLLGRQFTANGDGSQIWPRNLKSLFCKLCIYILTCFFPAPIIATPLVQLWFSLLGFPTERYFDAIINVFPPVRFSLLTPLPYILQTVQIVNSPLSGTSYHAFSCGSVCFYILQFRVVQVSMSCFHTHSFCCPHLLFLVRSSFYLHDDVLFLIRPLEYFIFQQMILLCRSDYIRYSSIYKCAHLLAYQVHFNISSRPWWPL